MDPHKSFLLLFVGVGRGKEVSIEKKRTTQDIHEVPQSNYNSGRRASKKIGSPPQKKMAASQVPDETESTHRTYRAVIIRIGFLG